MSPEMKPYYPEGLHVGEIVAHQLSKARTGNKQLLIRAKILGVPEGNNYLPHSFQYERTIYWTLTENTVPYIIEKLRRLHFEGGQISQLDPASSDPVSLVGHQVELWCSHEPGLNGGMRERWDLAQSAAEAGRMTVQPLSAKEVRELDMLFGKAFSSPGEKRKPNSAPPPTQQANPEITDDDIPF